MPTSPLYATAGVSGGLSFVTLVEWAKSPSTVSVAAFLGSTLATLIGWILARRAEIKRANLELERDRRRMERESRFLDALADRALKVDLGRLKVWRPSPESIDLDGPLDRPDDAA